MLRFAALGTAKRNNAAKQGYVLRNPHLRFGSYAVKLFITFCVNLLRFALSSYVLGNVTFCGPTMLLPLRVNRGPYVAFGELLSSIGERYVSL